MNQTLKISKKEAEPFLKATHSQYRGRKFQIEFTKTVTFWDTNWGGGTKNTYSLLSMETSGSKQIIAPAPWINPVEGVTIELPPTGVIVMHSIFCGHDLGITIYARPELAPKFLKA